MAKYRPWVSALWIWTPAIWDATRNVTPVAEFAVFCACFVSRVYPCLFQCLVACAVVSLVWWVSVRMIKAGCSYGDVWSSASVFSNPGVCVPPVFQVMMEHFAWACCCRRGFGVCGGVTPLVTSSPVIIFPL